MKGLYLCQFGCCECNPLLGGSRRCRHTDARTWLTDVNFVEASCTFLIEHRCRGRNCRNADRCHLLRPLCPTRWTVRWRNISILPSSYYKMAVLVTIKVMNRRCKPRLFTTINTEAKVLIIKLSGFTLSIKI
jgi:hypothetical protein